MEEFKPKLSIHDITDFFVFLIVGFFQTIILFVIPGYLVFIITNNELAGWASGVLLYVIFIFHIVKTLVLSETGIKLNRLFGNPKNITWEQIKGYKEASPQELIIYGWLWPIFPAREMTSSMSCKEHIRIQYRNGYFYYPPKDKESFIKALEKYGINEL